MKFGLTSSALTMIGDVFKTHPEVKTVRVFGSRAMGNYQPSSDIDLVLWGEVDQYLLGKIGLELDELPLPYHFDVKVYDQITHQALKQHITRYALRLYTADKKRTKL